MIPAGVKLVPHEFRVDNLKDYPNYAWFVDLHSTRPFEKQQPPREMKPDLPFWLWTLRFSHFTFYAVPKDIYDNARGEFQESWKEGKADGILKVDQAQMPVLHTAVGDLTEVVRYNYDVDIDANQLALKYKGNQRLNGAGKDVNVILNGLATHRSSVIVGLSCTAAVLLSFAFWFKRKDVPGKQVGTSTTQ